MSLTTIAYKIATEPDFITRLRENPLNNKEIELLSDDEQRALQTFLSQKNVIIRLFTSGDGPDISESGWWTP